MNDWEQRFASAIATLSNTERASPGGLLCVVPPRDEWDSFIASVQAAWSAWEQAFFRHPTALIILYDGVAFYRYESRNFWKGFAQVVGVPSIGVNEQYQINQHYQICAALLGLAVKCGEYNSAAIRQIGVPISMWEGVLGICEWALWTFDWQTLSDEDWKEAITRRLGGRKRLIEFLIANREAATEFIREMLAARELLCEDSALTLSDLRGVCHLRSEYFEEVPETADFLREENPESLFAERARLSWNESRKTLALHLPPVAQTMLPAQWRLGTQVHPAANTAGELVVNDTAFARWMRLELSCNGSVISQRIAGIEDWALWDEAKSRFVPRRDQLPLAQYTLISKQPLRPKLEGWIHDPDDPCTNLLHELSDGTPYYITRLAPESRRPRLKIGDGPWFTFTQRHGVTLRLFCGTNLGTASRFGLTTDGVLRVEDLPRPFLEVPLSLISDDEIHEEFEVFLDNQRARGRWKTYAFKPDGTDESNAEYSLCFWHWDDPPVHPPGADISVLRSFESIRAIGAMTVTPPAPPGLSQHSLYVQSRRLGRLPFGRRSQLEFKLLPGIIGGIWPMSWGSYLPWILLSQVQNEASWEEVRFAYEALSYGRIYHHVVYYAIRKIERHDYLAIRGHRYINFRNRIALSPIVATEFAATYCGLSTALYDLVRTVPPMALGVARADPGRPPALQLRWAAQDRANVRLACEQNEIQIVNNLW